MIEERVVAVTVTYNRFNTLENTLKALLKQSSKKLYKIIVVDNASSSEHIDKLTTFSKENDRIEVVYRDENLGGAGGFYHGMKYALEKYDPDYYWIMDDDAYPDDKCLENLLAKKSEVSDLGFLAPVIFGVGKKEYQLYHNKMISKYKVNDITREENFNNLKAITEIEADAFVGPLFPKNVVKDVGLPNGGLFIYGDDTEYTYRITRKYKGYLIKDAVINHEDPPYQGKAVAPQGWWKEYYMFRNRFMFISEFGENIFVKFMGNSYLIIHLLRRIFATCVKSHYAGNRKLRIEILLKAIFDGLNKRNGKTLDPKEYMERISKR